MRTSIIVPAFIVDKEVLQLATRFWLSLRAHTPNDDYQLVVVENGSTMFAPEPPVRMDGDVYIHKPSPIGYARATNIGLALADCERVVVTNVDIEFTPGWLETLHAEYDREGPGILSPDDSGRTGVWEESWFSCWMSDKRTLAKVGYLDESLPYLLHDQDMSIRMAKAGFSVKRTGAVQVKHQEASTRGKMNVDTSEECAIMFRRYGCLHFREWVAGGRK